MKKIIFLTEEIIRAGGVVRVVNMWANYFSKNNDVKVIAAQINNPYYSFNEKIKFMRCKFSFKYKILGLPYNIIQMYFLLKKLNKEKKLNIIVDRAVHIEPLWILRKLGLSKDINLIYFAHGGSSDFRDFYMNRPLVRHRVNMIFEAFDKVICLYDDETNYPKQVKKEKLFFIPNPLPFEPSNVNFSEKENIVLSLGRVTKEKGIDTLIKAWSKVEKEASDWKLKIVGDGKDKEEFIKLAKNLKIKNIKFLPSNPDVKQYYEKAKIFVIPSLFEGMPMTILEAMACKTAVISSKTAGGKKLIEHNENGLLFDIGNEKELSLYIQELINNQLEREKLASNGYKYVQQYKIDKIAQKWDRILS